MNAGLLELLDLPLDEDLVLDDEQPLGLSSESGTKRVDIPAAIMMAFFTL